MNQLLLPASVFQMAIHSLHTVSPCWSRNVLSDMLMLATVFIIVIGQLARCHRRAGRLDQAMHLTQQCISILRQSMPSTRKELCKCEC